jgi:hypothetical protein
MTGRRRPVTSESEFEAYGPRCAWLNQAAPSTATESRCATVDRHQAAEGVERRVNENEEVIQAIVEMGRFWATWWNNLPAENRRSWAGMTIEQQVRELRAVGMSDRHQVMIMSMSLVRVTGKTIDGLSPSDQALLSGLFNAVHAEQPKPRPSLGAVRARKPISADDTFMREAVAAFEVWYGSLTEKQQDALLRSTRTISSSSEVSSTRTSNSLGSSPTQRPRFWSALAKILSG